MIFYGIDDIKWDDTYDRQYYHDRTAVERLYNMYHEYYYNESVKFNNAYTFIDIYV